MPFALKKNKAHKGDEAAPKIVEQEQQEVGSAEEVLGQGEMDPTVSTVQETTLATGAEPQQISEQEVQPEPTTAEVIEQEIVGRGEELVTEVPEQPVTEQVQTTAMTVVAEQETKRPVLSARTVKTWTRGAKDKINVLMPGIAPNFRGDLVIKLIMTKNPKSRGPALRYAKYKDGMTVAEYVAACSSGPRALTTEKVSHADLFWDVNHGYIQVSVAAEGAPQKAVEQAA